MRESPVAGTRGGLSSSDGDTPQQASRLLLRCGSLLEEDHPWMVLLKAEVTVLLDTIQAAKWEERNPAQSREGTMVVPSCVPTSWQRLHAADSLTTRAKSSNKLTQYGETSS